MTDVTASRHGGNAASDAAFDKSAPIHQSDEDRIFELIIAAPGGLTSADLERILGKPKHKFSGRLTNLKRLGKVWTTGERREGAEVHVKAGPPRQLDLLLNAA